jgi:hypothetical protein
LEETQHEILFTRRKCITEQCQNHRLKEALQLCRIDDIDTVGQVDWLGLQNVEQILIVLKSFAFKLLESIDDLTLAAFGLHHNLLQRGTILDQKSDTLIELSDIAIQLVIQSNGNNELLLQFGNFYDANTWNESIIRAKRRHTRVQPQRESRKSREEEINGTQRSKSQW